MVGARGWGLGVGTREYRKGVAYDGPVDGSTLRVSRRRANEPRADGVRGASRLVRCLPYDARRAAARGDERARAGRSPARRGSLAGRRGSDRAVGALEDAAGGEAVFLHRAAARRRVGGAGALVGWRRMAV